MEAILNLNVGILGHVDSGKTTLAKILSQVASTAAFDKNPQSQVRGITLDLGFSSFVIALPTHLTEHTDRTKLQFTLVDCPGHASLIKTIIGGAQIIDFMLLVVDVTKGIQTQTAECIVIGQITCKKMIVVLNKIDLLDDSTKVKYIEKISKRINNTLTNTDIKHGPIVCIAANPVGTKNNQPLGIDELIKAMSEFAFLPNRNCTGSFLFAVDHCFAIKGQGTVLTGTVLQGSVALNDVIEIPSLNVKKKVKSLQMFKKPVNTASQGDRLGICITHFDPTLLERGIATTPGFAINITATIFHANRIKYFKRKIKSKSKFHVSIGHETVIGEITLFSTSHENTSFDFNDTYAFEEEFIEEGEVEKTYFALLEFERPIQAVPEALVIGSKLDIDSEVKNDCRLAFWGYIQQSSCDLNYSKTLLPLLQVYKNKIKNGFIERVVNEQEVIVKNLFKKESNISLFVGLNVCLSTGEIGNIECSFGQSGKVKVRIPNSLLPDTLTQLVGSKKSENVEKITVRLEFKRYIYDSKKKIIQ